MSQTTPEKEKFETSSPTDEERMWAMLAHMSILLQFVGVLVITFIVPLVLWLLKRDSSPFIENQAKEAMNFQITYLIVCCLLTVGCVTIPLILVAAVAAIVYGVIAGMKAYQGIEYRYPYTLRLVK